MSRQRIFIDAALGGYIAWDLFFLVQGKVPRSVFKVVTGLPCPTSGGWRSLQALVRGNWGESWRFNPFTTVFLALLLASGICIVRCIRRRSVVLLPPWLSTGWFAALALAWGAKFLLGPVYW